MGAFTTGDYFSTRGRRTIFLKGGKCIANQHILFVFFLEIVFIYLHIGPIQIQTRQQTILCYLGGLRARRCFCESVHIHTKITEGMLAVFVSAFLYIIMDIIIDLVLNTWRSKTINQLKGIIRT